MNKFYFMSYEDFSNSMPQIHNLIINTHPIIWERENSYIDMCSTNPDSNGITRFKVRTVIWWKELTDEEIQELGL